MARRDEEQERKDALERAMDRSFLMIEGALSTAVDLGHEMSQPHVAQVLAAGLRQWGVWLAQDEARERASARKGCVARANEIKATIGQIEPVAKHLEGWQGGTVSPMYPSASPNGNAPVDVDPIGMAASGRPTLAQLDALVGNAPAPATGNSQVISDIASYLRGETEDPYLAGADPGVLDRLSVLPDFSGTLTGVRDIFHAPDCDCLVHAGPAPEHEADANALLTEVKAEMMTDAAGAAADPFMDPTTGPAPLTIEDVSLPPARSIDHRSRSQLNEFNECAMRYRINRYDAPDQSLPAWYFVGGEAFHNCVESIERGRGVAGAGALSPEAIANLWAEQFNAAIVAQCVKTPSHPPASWRAAAQGSEGWTWWMANGEHMLNRYVAWRDQMEYDGWTVLTLTELDTNTGGYTSVPAVEMELTNDTLGTSVPWVGRLDLALYHHERDRILIVDFKTGSTSNPTDQLGDYAHAIMAKFRRPIANGIDGAFFDARKGVMTEPVDLLATHPLALVQYQYRAFDAAECHAAQTGLYPPRPIAFPYSPCGGCGVKVLCPIGSVR